MKGEDWEWEEETWGESVDGTEWPEWEQNNQKKSKKKSTKLKPASGEEQWLAADWTEADWAGTKKASKRPKSVDSSEQWAEADWTADAEWAEADWTAGAELCSSKKKKRLKSTDAEQPWSEVEWNSDSQMAWDEADWAGSRKSSKCAEKGAFKKTQKPATSVAFAAFAEAFPEDFADPASSDSAEVAGVANGHNKGTGKNNRLVAFAEAFPEDFDHPQRAAKGKGKAKGKNNHKGKKGSHENSDEFVLFAAEKKVIGSVGPADLKNQVDELRSRGVELSADAHTALSTVECSEAWALLIEAGDRAATEDASKFILTNLGLLDDTSTNDATEGHRKAKRPALPNPALFKLRFGQALAEDQAKGKKGKGKGKGK